MVTVAQRYTLAPSRRNWNVHVYLGRRLTSAEAQATNEAFPSYPVHLEEKDSLDPLDPEALRLLVGKHGNETLLVVAPTIAQAITASSWGKHFAWFEYHEKPRPDGTHGVRAVWAAGPGHLGNGSPSQLIWYNTNEISDHGTKVTMD